MTNKEKFVFVKNTTNESIPPMLNMLEVILRKLQNKLSFQNVTERFR